jgi:hypothetical protein
MKRHIDIDTRIDLEGPIDDVIVRLQSIQEKYKDHAGVRIETDPCYEGGYTYDLQRLETDEEYEQRLAKEAERVREREEREKAEYERLKAKFEK